MILQTNKFENARNVFRLSVLNFLEEFSGHGLFSARSFNEVGKTGKEERKSKNENTRLRWWGGKISPSCPIWESTSGFLFQSWRFTDLRRLHGISRNYHKTKLIKIIWKFRRNCFQNTDILQNWCTIVHNSRYFEFGEVQRKHRRYWKKSCKMSVYMYLLFIDFSCKHRLRYSRERVPTPLLYD